MQPVSLRTDLSDTKLAQLEYSAIQALIGQAQKEVQEASGKIFGSEADNSKEAKAKRKVVYEVNKTKTVATDLWTMLTTFKTTQEVIEETNHEEREAGAGEFGAHIGYAPVTKGNPNVDDGLDNIWIDKGTGELGRLMRSYIYWSMKESQGWASVNKPMWDKPAWDDRSSWFKAPTIRGITDIGVTIAASVMLPGAGSLLMNAALNLADDAVFTMLDVGGGYKSWEEAGLEFTKKAACSAVNVGVGQVFSPAITVANSTQGIGGVIGSTMLSGMQTLTTSTLNSAINAVNLQYDKDGNLLGLGWSADAFNAGVQGGLISAATGMTSSFTSGMLNLGLEGFVGKTYANAATLSNTIGSLAGQGVNYALTGDFTLNVLNFGMFGIKDANQNLVKNGLLELHLGKNGATMNVGMGGADVSLGTVAQSIAGLDAWRVNAELWTSKQDEAHKYTSGMRTLYSVGGAQELALYQELLQGKTNIEERTDGDYKAKTEANGDGTKTIYLGQGALADGSRFGLNILLAHEAYRNGKDDGTEGQRQETKQAVLGHIGAALALAQTYGMGSIGTEMAGEVNTYLEPLKSNNSDNNSNNNYEALGKLLAGYDASGDYWRLTKDGRLLNDGKKELRVEVVGDDGKTRWALVSGSEKETSIAAALVHYLGKDRALDLLKKDPSDISTYDDQTLKDVLGINDQVVAEMRKDRLFAATVLSNASAVKNNTFDRLIGEALMKQSGIQADGNSWKGEGSGITLTDGVIRGNAAMRYLGNGEYERYSITAEVTRLAGAYEIYKDGKAGDLGNGNTKLEFTKWDIDSGEKIASIVAGGIWNSVDNSYGQKDSKGNPIGKDQPLQYVFGPTVQGNTVAAGKFNMRWAENNSDWWGEVLTISDAMTIAGERIGPTGHGQDHMDEGRWRVHWTNYGFSDGCFVAKGQEHMTNLMNSLKSWGLMRGYSIASTMIDQNNYYTYAYRYKTRSW